MLMFTLSSPRALALTLLFTTLSSRILANRKKISSSLPTFKKPWTLPPKVPSSQPCQTATSLPIETSTSKFKIRCMKNWREHVQTSYQLHILEYRELTQRAKRSRGRFQRSQGKACPRTLEKHQNIDNVRVLWTRTRTKTKTLSLTTNTLRTSTILQLQDMES